MSKKIMIVEDNDANMSYFNSLLQAHGYTTMQARDGHNVLPSVKADRPDLILMDIQLPGLSGLEVTQSLKADEDLRDIPVVAVTAFALKGDEEKILRAGCASYVTKPIAVAALLDVVKEYAA